MQELGFRVCGARDTSSLLALLLPMTGTWARALEAENADSPKLAIQQFRRASSEDPSLQDPPCRMGRGGARINAGSCVLHFPGSGGSDVVGYDGAIWYHMLARYDPV